MAVKVPILVADPAGLLAAGAFSAGALVRIERSATVGGTYTEIKTTAIVGTQVAYDFWDTTGDETSWYRWRVSNAGNTLDSPYSAPFQGTSPTTEVVQSSYAALADVLGLFETQPAQPARVLRMARLLGPTAREINREIGRDYFRHPAVTGSEIRYLNSKGGPLLCVHQGIISLDTLEVRISRLNDYETVNASEIQLEPLTPELGRPYDHIRLLGIVRFGEFPVGPAAVRATGAFGWATPPSELVEANAERARQIAYMDGAYSGSAAGADEYGSPHPFTPMPDVLWRFIGSEDRRYACSL